jgi:hypothetical protein
MGSAAIVVVETSFAGRKDTARFVVPDAANECLATHLR